MVPAAPCASMQRKSRGRQRREKRRENVKHRKLRGARRGGKGRPIQERYECTRMVIKQLQRSFLSVSLSASRPCSPLLPLSSVRLSLCLLPFVSSLSSSFWTLSRCTCGNFPGSVLPGLLARSLTSLSSVYFHRHFSWHLRRLFSIGPFIFPSGFALSVFTSSPVAEHLRARAPANAFPSISVFIA